MVEGRGNSLDKNYHHSTENNLNFTAETTNTNVRLVSLLKRYGIHG
jgi:hypothetical protein